MHDQKRGNIVSLPPPQKSLLNEKKTFFAPRIYEKKLRFRICLIADKNCRGNRLGGDGYSEDEQKEEGRVGDLPQRTKQDYIQQALLTVPEGLQAELSC